jgi:hypothetical protein
MCSILLSTLPRLAMCVVAASCIACSGKPKSTESLRAPPEASPSTGYKPARVQTRLRVVSDPASIVSIDGHQFGSTPLLVELRPGTYTVEGTHACDAHSSATGRHIVTLTPGDMLTVQIALSPSCR